LHHNSAKLATLIFVGLILGFQASSDKTWFHSSSATPPVTQKNDPTIENVTFKLLAVEHHLGDFSMSSAQHLIKSLLSFSNWRNSTENEFRYFSYIHLLSEVDPAQIDNECQPFYKGKATKTNLMQELSNFLLNKSPYERENLSVHILYFVGNSHKLTKGGNTSYCLVLDETIQDWELDQALQGENDSISTLIILDTCYGGGFLEKLARPGRVILTASNPTETTSSYVSLDENSGSYWSWFTGRESATYTNDSVFGPLGIIGGIKAAEDSNRDGWRSAAEIFNFTLLTTPMYIRNQTFPEKRQDKDLNPWGYFGIAGGALPVVQYDPSKPFPHNAKSLPTFPQTPNPFHFNSEEFQFRMYHYSPSHTGFSKAIGPEKPHLLWKTFMSDPLEAAVAVADGMVFAGTMGGNFYALEISTGKVVWSFHANDSISSSPAVEDGIVIFQTQSGRIYAIDEYTGNVRWYYPAYGENPAFSSPTIKNKKVFIACSDGYLRAFTLFEGLLKWQAYIGGVIYASPAVSNDTVFITANDVYAFEEATGTLLWRYTTSWPVFSSPAFENGVLYVGTGNDDTIYALNATTGKPIWSHRTGGWLSSPSIDTRKGLVFLGCRDSRIYCIDAKNGLLKWSFITEGANHLSSPTLSINDLIYVGSSDHRLYCLDENKGQKIWSYKTGGPITCPPTIIEQHVYVGSQDGYLYCLGPPFPTHDTAVLNVTFSPGTCKPGELVEINYSVQNNGNTLENLTLTYAHNKSKVWLGPEYLEPEIIYKITITINPREKITGTYVWNTSSMQPGRYSLTVRSELVTEEVNASNNIFINGPFTLTMLTDLDMNGAVNILDIAVAAKSYGARLGDEGWNKEADLDDNGIINIVDIASVARDFGKVYF